MNLQRIILRGLLTDPQYKFRKLETLRIAIRESAETTREILSDIGARQSTDGQDLYTLNVN